MAMVKVETALNSSPHSTQVLVKRAEWVRSEQSAGWRENVFVLRQSMFGVSGALERQGGPEPGGLWRGKITSAQLKTPQAG